MNTVGHLPWWKSLLLGCYYRGTYPARWWSNALRRAEGQAPVMVLFYHRIADDAANVWTTSTRVFERQMLWLKANFDMVSLAEAQRRIASPGNHRPSVSVTFDDGYADNCRAALPLLIRQGIPCTYFVATHHMLTGQPFPHDVALGRPAAPNSAAEIKALADAGVEIGSHTRRHADMGQVYDADRLHEELVESRDDLQRVIERKVHYFAFPFGQHGNMTSAAFSLAKQVGYQGVCSAYNSYNFASDDSFHIQRIHADDDLLRLKNWVTLDPRKLLATQRFQYKLSPTCNGLAGAAS